MKTLICLTGNDADVRAAVLSLVRSRAFLPMDGRRSVRAACSAFYGLPAGAFQWQALDEFDPVQGRARRGMLYEFECALKDSLGQDVLASRWFAEWLKVEATDDVIVYACDGETLVMIEALGGKVIAVEDSETWASALPIPA